MRSLDRIAPVTVLAACFGLFGGAAWRRPFWFDETYSGFIAALPTLSDMWGAVRAGFDLSPPLFHLITRAFSGGWARPELALRLPGLIGIGIMAACLFVFTRRRCGLAASLVAMVFPLATVAGRYAVEARPYGMVLGACGAALVFWQSAVDGRHRRASLMGVAIAIAAAVSLHYYAFLILLPIGVGELVRLVRDRRADWAVWSAAAIGALALPFNVWLVGLSREHLRNAWAPAPEWKDLSKFLWQMWGPVAPVALLLGTIVLLRAKRSWPRAHETAAAVTLAALPLIVYALGVTVTGMFIGRYALPAALGIGILLAFALDAEQRLARAVVAALCVMFAANAAGAFSTVVEAAAPAQVAQRPDVVSASGLRFLQMNYYGARNVRYIANPPAALKWVGSDALDRELLAMRPWAPIRVEEYGAVAARKESFVFYCREWHPTWLLPQLREDGARVRIVERWVNTEGIEERLYSVEWP